MVDKALPTAALQAENARVVALLKANGRLHREHAGKTDVLIYDYVDTGNPVLERMWQKRQRGYQAMGYRIETEADNSYRQELLI